MVVLSWILGIVSVLGGAGTIAAFVFFPTVAAPIVEAVTRTVLACKPCLLAAGAVAIALSSFWYGYRGEHAKGYQAALSAIAAEDAAAIQAATEKREIWKECRARNGQWDQSTGECK